MTPQVAKETIERQHQGLLAELRFQVAKASDDERVAGSARQLAGRLAQIPREKLDLAQVRNLESLAYSTDKVSDLTDLLKKRIGRDSRGERWAHDGVGQALIKELEGLRERANKIADALKKYDLAYDNDLARRIHLLLCREHIRHLVANFEYLRLEKEVTR